MLNILIFLLKAARKGISGLQLFAPHVGLIPPWILFALPNVFRSTESSSWMSKLSDFSKHTVIALELKILLNSPQANWPLLIKLLLMRDSTLSTIIFGHLIKFIPLNDGFKAALELPFLSKSRNQSKCDGFICGKDCDGSNDDVQLENGWFIIHIVLMCCFIVYSNDCSI